MKPSALNPAPVPTTTDAAALPLDQAIVLALTGETTAAAAGIVLTNAQASLRALSAQADQADVDSLSPLVTSAEALTLRQKANGLRFETDRLDASVSALRARVDELGKSEEAVKAKAEKAAALAERDALAADIREQYPRIVRELTTLVKRIHDCEQRIGIWETSPEAIGRGLTPNMGNKDGGTAFAIRQCRLDMPNGERAWDMDALAFPGLRLPVPPSAIRLPESRL